jgi:hypothetical protein
MNGRRGPDKRRVDVGRAREHGARRGRPASWAIELRRYRPGSDAIDVEEGQEQGTHRVVGARHQADLARLRQADERPAVAVLERQDTHRCVLRDRRSSDDTSAILSHPELLSRSRASDEEGATYSSVGSVPSKAQSAQASCPSTSSQLGPSLGERLRPASSRTVLADETGLLSQALSRKAVEVWWAESNEPATEPTWDAGRVKLSRLRCGGLTGGGGPARERRRVSVVEGSGIEAARYGV